MRSKLEANGKSLLRPKTEPCMGGSPGLLVMGGDFVPKVVGSNSSTVYLMDNFSRLFVVKIVLFI